MQWTDSIRRAIRFMEEHLLEHIGPDDVAREVNISPFYLQKGFSLMTGCSLSEYIRNRRLYQAALELLSADIKVIDAALKYGYDTPESFTKAFRRFHGVSPSQLQGDSRMIKPFLPLRISIELKGGSSMDYTVEKMDSFRLIGFEREFSFESSYQEIPLFWSEIFEKYEKPILAGKQPETAIERAMCENMVGEFGLCVDDLPDTGNFRYFIAGVYRGGEVPEGMSVYEIPEAHWAKFRCIGPMPGSLQSVNTQIFKEWLPENNEYEIALQLNIEWYSAEGKTTDADYESAVWIPVKKRVQI